MLKKIVLGLLVLVVLVAAVAWYGFSNLDHFIKVAVEKYGTAATQATVKLDSVTLSLTSGQGSLGGFSVGNPKGFSSATALSLGTISVAVDTNSIAGKGPIVIKSVTIDKPQVAYEIANDGSSNLQTISRNTESYASAMTSGHAASNAPASNPINENASADQGRKLIIDDLVVSNGEVGVSQSMLKGKALSAPLPVIHLTNIGKSTGGATAAQVAQQVLGSITSEAAKVASTQFASQLAGSLKGVAGSAAGSVGGAVNSGVTGVSGVGGQLKNLIGQ
jgi:hypothetical protein